MGDFSTSHDAGRLSPERGRLPSSPLRACKRPLAFALALLMAACTSPQPPVATSPSAATRSPQPAHGTLTATAAAAPIALNGAEPEGHVAKPLIAPGTGVFAAASATRAAHVDVGPEGDVSFNFVNADVREVVREILGNQLHLNYVVDSKVQAMITAQTGGPVPKQAVLPTLESVLRANGLALVQVNGLYRVLPIEDAAKSGAAAGRGQPGYGVRVLPLHFVSGSEIKGVLEPFLPAGSVLQVDSARNLLIVSGASADLDGFIDLVRQFDVDWLTGTSFALYPLKVGAAKDIATELDAIFGEGGSGPLAGLVRIVPIERLNALLVISPHQAYLSQVKTWIDRLDYGDDQTTPRVFEYHVQNSRAADLAAVLTQLLSSGSVTTVQPQVAPGMKLVDMSSQQQGLGGAPGVAGTGGLPGASSTLGMNTTPGATSTTGIGTGLPAAGTGVGLGTGTAAQTPSAGQTGSLSNRQSALQPGLKGNNDDLKTPSVRIVADEKNNALVIYARPRDYKMIEDAIKRLDVVPLQVLIEATIAEVTLNDNLQYGLQWFFSKGASQLELNNGIPASVTTATTGTTGAATTTTGAATSLTNLAGTDISPIFPGFNYLAATSNFKVILNALSNLTQVNVVSSPEVLVLDHQTAALQVGDQVPVITQSAQSTIATGAPIVNSVQYLNTGVVLQVTPRVNSTGLITLDIDQSVSDVAKTTTSTIDSPTITQRRIVTSAIVQDGETIALGGLIIDNQTNGKSGVPLLSSIPLIGPLLFSSTSKSNARTELLVLLTPKILRNAQEARATTDELRDRMRALKPLEQRIR
ncbi:MAG TPA: type II secretion system secretin GspD [Stellaceae bacterium]|nr:type II secretion system secretin GspD [Stellaceae bacterium]